MGVPSYFAWWVKQYASRILTSTLPIPKGRRARGPIVLYLDFNGLIHPACRTDPDLARSGMNGAVCEYLRRVVDIVNPDEVYIAIDGVAPFAKMDQQRDRRFKSVKESKIRREIAQKHNQPVRREDVDFNMISPGTDFMWLLQAHLESYIVDMKAGAWNTKRITLNGSNLPGEGEHKIMADIRARGEELATSRVCIYGLDADLMFLSLLNIPEAVLVRENMFFRGRDKLDLDPEMFPYVFLNIGELREIMIETLRPQCTLDGLQAQKFKNNLGPYTGAYNCRHYKETEADKTSLLRDYAYICFFLGNDFLPRLPCLKIRNGNLDDVVVLYKRVSWQLGAYLIQMTDGQPVLNREFLSMFLETLSGYENELLEIHREQRFRDIQRSKHMMRGKTPFEREIEDFSYVEDKYNDTILPGTPGWRVRYYCYHMGWRYRTNAEFARLLEPVCREYLQGTMWVLRYYLGLHNNWSWIYPYSAAPSAQDLAYALGARRADSGYIDLSPVFPDETPVSPYVQLLSILPPDSAELLPPVLRSIMTDKDSPVHYLYPLKVSLSMEGNKFWYECKAKLPHVDQQALCDIVGTKTRYLTPVEKERNGVGEVVRT